MKIFVYGSLKPGGWSHHLIQNAIGEGTAGSVEGSLYDAGNFPALKPDKKGIVHGIMYEINLGEVEEIMVRLDRLEGYPNLFGRMQMPVSMGNCTEYALVYYGIDEHLFSEDHRIASGHWDV